MNVDDIILNGDDMEKIEKLKKVLHRYLTLKILGH